MTDKEQLELAAKAAGISITWDERWNCFMRDARPIQEFDSEWLPWRPLTDDGDALRLAVKLNFEIYIGRTYVHVEDWNGRTTKIGSDEISDIYAATRRAIVRAAAEIGNTL